MVKRKQKKKTIFC